MGRNSTDAITTDACKRISISFLKQSGYLKSGCLKYGTCKFNGDGEPNESISISTNTIGEPYLQLKYAITDNTVDKKTNINYKIKLVKVRSNLGKGFRYYFLCPFSFKKCEILYMAYGSLYFKHRQAYSHRIYYPQQMESKLGRRFRYPLIEEKFIKLYSRKIKNHYKGKKTRRLKRIEVLEGKYEYYSMLAEVLLTESL